MSWHASNFLLSQLIFRWGYPSKGPPENFQPKVSRINSRATLCKGQLIILILHSAAVRTAPSYLVVWYLTGLQEPLEDAAEKYWEGTYLEEWFSWIEVSFDASDV